MAEEATTLMAALQGVAAAMEIPSMAAAMEIPSKAAAMHEV